MPHLTTAVPRLQALAILLLLTVAPDTASAQGDTLVAAAGDRIRLWAGSPEELRVGTLLDSGTPGWIWLLAASDTVRFQRPEIARLEVAQHVNKRVGRKALIGAGVGFVAGFVLGVATDEEDTLYLDPSPAEAGLAVGGAGALIGGLLGMLIGVSTSGTAWLPGQLPEF